VVAGVIISATAFAGDYVAKDTFPDANGTPLNNLRQWKTTGASVMVTNNAAIIPVLNALTNVVETGLTDKTNVWTEFLTVARPFQPGVELAPDLDTNATAQFFVHSNGSWAVISRDGGGNLTTNIYGDNLYGSSITNRNDGVTPTRVSVLHNYGARQWSLFIAGMPVVTNCGFINTNEASYKWLSVQSLGGDVSNRTLLDDVLITNAVPLALTNDYNSNGLRDAWELMYYGNLNSGLTAAQSLPDGWTVAQKSAAGLDPSITMPVDAVTYAFGSSNAGIAAVGRTNATATAVTLDIVTEANRSNTVLGATGPNGPWTSLGSFYTGSGGTNEFNDATGTGRGSWYFYAVASTLDLLTVTNPVKSVFYNHPVNITGTNEYLVGIPIDYGSNNTLDSTLGAQLAAGLPGGVDQTEASTLTVYNPTKTYWLQDDGTWMDGAVPATDAIPLGRGVRITRIPGVGWDGASSILLSGVANTSNVTLSIGAQWNLLAWDQHETNKVWSTGTGGTGDNDTLLADHVWLYKNGQYKHLRLWVDGTWHFEPNFKEEGQLLPGNTSWGTKYPGQAFFYYSQGVRTWNP
jgi:hypothetical protein